MLNKTQLSTNNERLTSLIQELQGKTASETNVETCTVVLDPTGSGGAGFNIVAYNALNDNGEVINVWSTDFINTNITIPNVVCGSIIAVQASLDVEEITNIAPSWENGSPSVLFGVVSAPKDGIATIKLSTNHSGGAH